MGLIRQMIERWARPPAPLSQIVPTWVTAFPLPPKEQVRVLLEQGYRREALIYACINEIATSAAEPEIKAGYLQSDGTVKEDPNHPLRMIFRRPNPQTTSFGLVNRMLIDLEATGNLFVQKVRNAKGATVQLWNVRPDRIKFKVNTDGTMQYYEYSFDGTNPQAIRPEDMIFDKFPDPLDDFWGLSPITALARYGDLDTETADFLRAYFHNAGAPAGILNMKAKATKEERERIRSLWRERYSGLQGWHDLAILDADVEYQPIAGSTERLRLNYIFDATETRICMAFGVPPIIVGAAIGMMRSTFANYREARNSFWDETLAPLYKQIGQTLSRCFADEYGADLVVYFDLDNVSALQEDAEVKRRFGLDAWNAGLATKNEAREMAGLPPDPLDGDDYKQQTTSPASTPQPLMGSGDPLAGLLGMSRNGNGHALEVHHKPEREQLGQVIAELQTFLRAHLEAPAQSRVEVGLHVETDAGKGLERMAEGMGHLAHAILETKPPTVQVDVAAPHVEVHAPASQAKVIEVKRGPDGRLESAVVKPE